MGRGVDAVARDGGVHGCHVEDADAVGAEVGGIERVGPVARLALFEGVDGPGLVGHGGQAEADRGVEDRFGSVFGRDGVDGGRTGFANRLGERHVGVLAAPPRFGRGAVLQCGGGDDHVEHRCGRMRGVDAGLIGAARVLTAVVAQDRAAAGFDGDDASRGVRFGGLLGGLLEVPVEREDDAVAALAVVELVGGDPVAGLELGVDLLAQTYVAFGEIGGRRFAVGVQQWGGLLVAGAVAGVVGPEEARADGDADRYDQASCGSGDQMEPAGLERQRSRGAMAPRPRGRGVAGTGTVAAASAALGTPPPTVDARGVPVIHTCRLRGADYSSHPGPDLVRKTSERDEWRVRTHRLVPQHPYSRMAAPKRSAAAATAASRMATPSSLVSVRSAARSSILNANDFRSSPSFASR